jgi:hypothetical protein
MDGKLFYKKSYQKTYAVCYPAADPELKRSKGQIVFVLFFEGVAGLCSCDGCNINPNPDYQ